MGTRVSELPVVTSITGTDTMPIVQGGNTVQVSMQNVIDTLDQITTGTFTPILTFGGLSVGITYAANQGYWTKAGKMVFINGQIALTSKGTSTGDAVISGLPLPSSNENANYSAVSLRINGITYTGSFQGFVNINASTINLNGITEAGVVSNLTNTNFSNTSVIVFSACYRIA